MERWLVTTNNSNKRKRNDATDEVKSTSPFETPMKKRKIGPIITTPISTKSNQSTGLTPMIGNINVRTPFTQTTTSINTNSNNYNNNKNATNNKNNKQNSKPNNNNTNNNNKKKTKNNKNNKNNKRKHNGHSKRGTYTKDNPHEESWYMKTEEQKQELQKRLKWWITPNDEEKGHCSKCIGAMNGCALAKGISIYASSTATRKLNLHDKHTVHTDAIKFEKKLNDPNNANKIAVFTENMIKNKEGQQEDDYLRKMKPLVAIAFFIANSRLAIRKFREIRCDLLPTIIHEMIIVFKETFDESMLKEMQQMASKYESQIWKLEHEKNGIIKNRIQIDLLKTFIEDIDNSFRSLRKILADMDDPLISTYLQNQTDFTQLLSCIAVVRRNILCEQIRESPVHTIEADETTDKSLYNMICYWLTNRIGVEIVNDIMGIKNANYSIDFVVNKLSRSIVNEFKKIKKRRGPRNKYKKKKKDLKKKKGRYL